MTQRSAKWVAQQAHDFLATEFGQYFITALSLQYNGLHQDAEGVLTAEQKAMKVERAAGVKVAIDYLMTRDQQLQSGVFDGDEEKLTA